ncbi:AAA family ATPase [Cystobacter fuscus]
MVARLKRLLSEIKDEEDDVARFVWKLEGEEVRSDAALLSWLGGYALALQNPIAEARAKSLPGWFVAGYGTQRQLPVPLSASEQKDRVLNRLEPLFGKAPLVGTGFANQFVDTPRFEPFLQALTKVFVDNQLLPHVDAVELRGRGGVTQPGDLVRSHSFEFAFSGQKTKIPATWLSQGYQSTIAWIADLIGQMYLDVGEAIPLEDMEGMVLIDELDLHLHPRWQVRLVPVLKRVFPRMQFIVTTHSPMLLPALERHEIIMLRLDEHGDVVAEPPPTGPSC